MNHYPLIIRFFGTSEAHLLDLAVPTLKKLHCVYLIRIINFELILKIWRGALPPQLTFKRVTSRLKPYFIGVGKQPIENIVGQKLIQRHVTITSAESLTAGLFQSFLGRVPGISAVFSGGFVTYSDAVKHRLLAIPKAVISRYGVVSKPVAKWMAKQSRRKMQTDLGISFTGVAGPNSLEGQPVGTVGIGLATPHLVIAKLYHLKHLYQALTNLRDNSSTRNGIRLLSAKFGFKMIENLIEG